MGKESSSYRTLSKKGRRNDIRKVTMMQAKSTVVIPLGNTVVHGG